MSKQLVIGVFLTNGNGTRIYDSIFPAINNQQEDGLSLRMYSNQEDTVSTSDIQHDYGIEAIASLYTETVEGALALNPEVFITAGKPKLDSLLFKMANGVMPVNTMYIDKILLGGQSNTLSLVERELILTPAYLRKFFGLDATEAWFPELARLALWS